MYFKISFAASLSFFKLALTFFQNKILPQMSTCFKIV